MRKPAWILGLVAAAVIGSSAHAQSVLDLGNANASSTGSAAQMRASENAAASLLYKRVESVDWTEISFEEVIDWLRDESQGMVNIIIRWRPLSVENVSQESLVTLKLFNTRVADVLNEVLEQLSDDDQLGYHAYGNIIRISSKQDLNRQLYMRVYDVADLLFRVEDFGEEAPQIDLQQTGGTGGGGGGGGGQSVFQGGSSGGGTSNRGGEQAEQELLERLEELRDKIKNVIAPESWEGDRGGRGRIEIINRSLIVVNTVEVHEQLSGAFSFGG